MTELLLAAGHEMTEFISPVHVMINLLNEDSNLYTDTGGDLPTGVTGLGRVLCCAVALTV